MSTTQRMQSPLCSQEVSHLSRLCGVFELRTYMHIVEAIVDFSELPVVGNIFVDLDFAIEVI